MQIDEGDDPCGAGLAAKNFTQDQIRPDRRAAAEEQAGGIGVLSLADGGLQRHGAVGLGVGVQDGIGGSLAGGTPVFGADRLA